MYLSILGVMLRLFQCYGVHEYRVILEVIGRKYFPRARSRAAVLLVTPMSVSSVSHRRTSNQIYARLRQINIVRRELDFDLTNSRPIFVAFYGKGDVVLCMVGVV